MKIVLLTTIILSALNQGWSQSYNQVIKDDDINNFMISVLLAKEPYSSIFNRTPKKVFKKPIHIGKANWSFSGQGNFEFDSVFSDVLRKAAFTDEDSQYLKSQYESMRETSWKFQHKELKLKKNKRRGYYQYSIPLFTKDRTRAIMWRYKYCGSLCAYSELHLYVYKNGKWEVDQLLAGWIS